MERTSNLDRPRTLSFTLAAALIAGGCASPTFRAPATPEGGAAPPAALIGGNSVTWTQLIPALSELAGGAALEETALDLALEQRCVQRGLTIGAQQIQTESELLRRSLDADPDRAERMLEQVRAARSLGPARFSSLLRRSAMLRALVGPVDPPSGVLASAERSRTSAASSVRIIACPSEAEASAVRQRVSGSNVDPMVFAAIAAELSVDESSQRGGAIDPVAEEDTSIPAALRRAVAETPVGSVTPVVATGELFVVALVESRSPARPPLTEDERRALRHDVGLRWQRLEMERLARQVLAQTQVVPMDRSLHYGWEQGRRAGAPR